MTARDCPHFQVCSAPLCPMDALSMQDGFWFPNDPVCRRTDVPNWVKRQRSIVRRIGQNAERGAFTVTMLSHPSVIGKKYSGLDLERTDLAPETEAEWCMRHPSRKPLSELRLQNLKQTRILRLAPDFSLEVPERIGGGTGNTTSVVSIVLRSKNEAEST